MYSLKKNYENICLNVSYDFSKFDNHTFWGVTFLVVPPKDAFALKI
jgi:hypothetical protein